MVSPWSTWTWYFSLPAPSRIQHKLPSSTICIFVTTGSDWKIESENSEVQTKIGHDLWSMDGFFCSGFVDSRRSQIWQLPKLRSQKTRPTSTTAPDIWFVVCFGLECWMYRWLNIFGNYNRFESIHPEMQTKHMVDVGSWDLTSMASYFWPMANFCLGFLIPVIRGAKPLK